MNIGKRELEELKKISSNYENDLKKIKKGYPIQYLIGYVDFYDVKIKVNKNVLIPRPETEFLVEKVLNYAKKYNFDSPTILDLCTGSGAIALSLKRNINSTIYASDISKKALKVAKQNAKLNNLEVTFIKSNIFKKIKNHKFDIIVSNPPYVSTREILSKEVLKEPHKALFSGKDGTKHIKKIIKNINKYMKEKSFIAVEINSYSEKEIKKQIEKSFNNIKYSFEKDLTGKIRYLFIFKNCE